MLCVKHLRFNYISHLILWLHKLHIYNWTFGLTYVAISTSVAPTSTIISWQIDATIYIYLSACPETHLHMD